MGIRSGLRRDEQEVAIPAVLSQDSRTQDLNLDTKAEISQNCRFGREVGSVIKRQPVAYYNGTVEAAAIDSCYRYYNTANSTQYLIQLNNNVLRVGNDSTRTFSTLWTWSASSGKRFSAVTYQDICYISTGYDNVIATDGIKAWEMGSCKATLGTGAGNLDQLAYYYAVVFTVSGTDVVNGALSNTITCDASNQKIELSNIPLGPAGCTARKIYRTEGGDTTLKLLTTLANNTATTYSDNVADVTLGAAMAAITDDVPKCKYLLIFQERLFMANEAGNNRGSYVYYSDQYLPHYIPTYSADLSTTAPGDYYDVVSPDDGDEITAIVNQLAVIYIFKQNSIRPYYVKGVPTVWTLGDVLTQIGSPAGNSVVHTEYGILYLGWDHLYLFNGQYSSPTIDEFVVEEHMLDSRRLESFGYYWNGLYFLGYTDADDGKSYHDRVMVYDLKHKFMSIDKGGPQTSGGGVVNINCFASFKGTGEWGQLYAGDSALGWVYEYDRTVNYVQVNTVSGFDSGTHSDTMAVGVENNPVLTKFVLDNMESLQTDELAQAAWVTSETTEKIPPNLGNGSDKDKTVSEDEELDPATYQYASLTVDAGMTLTLNNSALILVLNDVTVNGTIVITNGHLEIDAVNITVGAAGKISGDSGTVHLRANTITVVAGGVLEQDVTETLAGLDTSGANAYAIDDDFETTYSSTSQGAGASTFTDEIAFDSTGISQVKVRYHCTGYEGGSSTCSMQLYYAAAYHTIDTISSNAYPGITTISTGWAGVTKARMYSTLSGKAAVQHFSMRVYGEPTMDYINSGGVTASANDVTDFVNALECYSENTDVNEGSYSLKVVCANGAITLNESLERTIASVDISNAKHDIILLDVKSNRDGTNLQFGIGEAAGTDNLVNVPITAADTWETVALDFSGVADASKNAIIKLGLKFTNTDTTNILYVDNIRTGLTGADCATWTSPVYQINASTMGSISWNENLNTNNGTHANTVDVSTRTGGVVVPDGTWTAWSADLTDPSGSTITSVANQYFQFKVIFTCADATGIYFPTLYKASGFVIKATYYKVSSASESAVEFRYRTGWRNYGKAMSDKNFRKIVSVHDGTTGIVSIIAQTDLQDTQEYTFNINLVNNSKRWDSNFPSTMYGRELNLEWYKNDANDFTFKQYALVLENMPVI